MAFYGWHNCPVAVRKQIDHLTATLSDLLAGRLIGIYLHGSLAMGCFNPQRSDLDILAVTADRIPLTVKRQIIEHLLACSQQPHPLEISFLARDQLRPWLYPTPFDLHYSEMWRPTCAHDLISGTWQAWDASEHRDPDLAAHITILNARGICLTGVPVAAIFPPVPADDYHASLAGDLHDSLASIVANPVYAVLNCCRTYAYVRDGHIFSKDEGGRWALGVLPADLGDTVTAALAAYRSDVGSESLDPDALSAFAAYMRQALMPILRYGDADKEICDNL